MVTTQLAVKERDPTRHYMWCLRPTIQPRGNCWPEIIGRGGLGQTGEPATTGRRTTHRGGQTPQGDKSGRTLVRLQANVERTEDLGGTGDFIVTKR
jgi:hypothetical protein